MVEVTKSDVGIIPVGKYTNEEFESVKQQYLGDITLKYPNSSSRAIHQANTVEFSDGTRVEYKKTIGYCIE